MFSSRILTAIAGVSLVSMGSAEVLQLKDNATVSGKIVADKRDSVAVDVGYTVLVIPRTEIVKISGDAVAPVTKKSSPKSGEAKARPAQVDKTGFFRTALGNLPERSVRELVNQLGESVVQVRTPGGLGSGFFVNEEGYLVTNFHVIEGETKISVEVYQLKDGQLERKNYKEVRIIAMNKFADLALLKVEDKGAGKFSPVPLGSADVLAVGERVFAIGSPLGLERTVTEGIVSTKTRQMQGSLYLQTTAQINPGNSGGPLFNQRGEVVGVTNMKITFGEGLGFAIPIEEVKFFLNHRDAYAYDTDNPSNPYRYLAPPSKTKRASADDARPERLVPAKR